MTDTGHSLELNFGRVLRNAERFHEREAVVDLARGHTSTYATHIERVGRITSSFRQLGIAPTDRVAVLAEASHVYIELWRACCSGAAIINPINTRLALPEVIDILNDSGSCALIVSAEFAPLIADVRSQLPDLAHVIVDDGPGDADVPNDHLLSSLIANAATVSLAPEPDEHAPAVLMYTGGTTGRAKGVVLSQRAITLSCYRMQPVVDVGGHQSYLSFMPMFHVGASSSWSFYLPSGGRSVVLPRFEPAAVNAAIANQGITAIGAVPTMLTMMLNDEAFDPAMLRTLELIVYGGSPMPPSLLTRILEAAPDVGIHQAYGMTEICGVATALTPADHRAGGARLSSVGQPALGVSLEIRDPATRNATEHGAVGEIWLRSDSVMAEYWGQPELTADSVTDGWYRTGDAGRLDADGYLHLVDRIKDMIVTGGENVYSLEVEKALNTHEGVDQVAVIGLPDPIWGERVHAVVSTNDMTTTAEELGTHARQRLAGYKVPKSWTLQTDPLPLSAAGKILKTELRRSIVAITHDAVTP